MTLEQINAFQQAHLITFRSVELEFEGYNLYGYFNGFPDNDELKKTNHYRIVENNNSSNYNVSQDLKYTTVINGSKLISMTAITLP